MKIESIVYSADVQLNIPKKWGKLNVIVEEGENLYDLIHDEFDEWTQSMNELKNNNLAYFSLCLTNGFDLHARTIRFRLDIDGDFELLNRTIQAMKIKLNSIYAEIKQRTLIS